MRTIFSTMPGQVMVEPFLEHWPKYGFDTRIDAAHCPLLQSLDDELTSCCTLGATRASLNFAASAADGGVSARTALWPPAGGAVRRSIASGSAIGCARLSEGSALAPSFGAAAAARFPCALPGRPAWRRSPRSRRRLGVVSAPDAPFLLLRPGFANAFQQTRKRRRPRRAVCGSDAIALTRRFANAGFSGGFAWLGAGRSLPAAPVTLRAKSAKLWRWAGRPVLPRLQLSLSVVEAAAAAAQLSRRRSARGRRGWSRRILRYDLSDRR